ncbi:hypothetical protein HK096_010712 [Nowakowskiella sp. JEL0078]|nr:hypothetical protein HK096_010712 [Nowakowskiella sp. JEL0078]
MNPGHNSKHSDDQDPAEQSHSTQSTDNTAEVTSSSSSSSLSLSSLTHADSLRDPDSINLSLPTSLASLPLRQSQRSSSNRLSGIQIPDRIPSRPMNPLIQRDTLSELYPPNATVGFSTASYTSLPSTPTPTAASSVAASRSGTNLFSVSEASPLLFSQSNDVSEYGTVISVGRRSLDDIHHRRPSTPPPPFPETDGTGTPPLSTIFSPSSVLSIFGMIAQSTENDNSEVEEEEPTEEIDDDDDEQVGCWSCFPCLFLLIALGIICTAVWPLIPHSETKSFWLNPGERKVVSINPRWFHGVEISVEGSVRLRGDALNEIGLMLPFNIPKISPPILYPNATSVYIDSYLFRQLPLMTDITHIHRTMFPILSPPSYARPSWASDSAFIRIENLEKSNMTLLWSFNFTSATVSSFQKKNPSVEIQNQANRETESFINFMILKSDQAFSFWVSGLSPSPSEKIYEEKHTSSGSLELSLSDKDVYYIIFYVPRGFLHSYDERQPVLQDSTINLANGEVSVEMIATTYSTSNNTPMDTCEVYGPVNTQNTVKSCNLHIPLLEEERDKFLLFSAPQCSKDTNLISQVIRIPGDWPDQEVVDNTCPDILVTFTTQTREGIEWWPLWVFLVIFGGAILFFMIFSIVNCFCPFQQSLRSRGFGRFHEISGHLDEYADALPVYTPRPSSPTLPPQPNVTNTTSSISLRLPEGAEYFGDDVDSETLQDDIHQPDSPAHSDDDATYSGLHMYVPTRSRMNADVAPLPGILTSFQDVETTPLLSRPPSRTSVLSFDTPRNSTPRSPRSQPPPLTRLSSSRTVTPRIMFPTGSPPPYAETDPSR